MSAAEPGQRDAEEAIQGLFSHETAGSSGHTRSTRPAGQDEAGGGSWIHLGELKIEDVGKVMTCPTRWAPRRPSRARGLGG